MNRMGVLATSGILLLAVIFPCFLPTPATPPGLGDWGDYLAAVIAAIAFVWLIVGHLHNQKQILENQKDLKDQMILTREIIGALTRIASSTQVKAAEALVKAQPVFVEVDGTGPSRREMVVSARPVGGHINFRNMGDGVTLVSVESKTEGLRCTLKDAGGVCINNGVFTVEVVTDGPIKAIGKIGFVVTFKDNFERMGIAKYSTDGFGVKGKIEVVMGIPAPVQA